MQEGIEESPKTLRQGSSDIRQFLQSTGKEIDHILGTNFHYLENHIKKTLNGELKHFNFCKLNEHYKIPKRIF